MAEPFVPSRLPNLLRNRAAAVIASIDSASRMVAIAFSAGLGASRSPLYSFVGIVSVAAQP
jgi:hypothetical protein